MANGKNGFQRAFVKRRRSGVSLVLSTVASSAEARRIASTVTRERLAACVSVIPGATSFYRWQGKQEKAREHILLFKTTASSVRRLTQRIRKIHSYKVPEILSFSAASGSADYLAWVTKETRRK